MHSLIVLFSITISFIGLTLALPQDCPDYSDYSQAKHPPYSRGKYQLSNQRPTVACRTFTSVAVESTIARLSSVITDPDLFRLFENSYPNSLDTAVRWKGHAANSNGEDLTFLITGDIDAMWLRDSANQMQSYLPLLQASSSNNSLASIYRGVINLQSRYLLTAPFCNAFKPPVESGIINRANNGDSVYPYFPRAAVLECKYELDSLAAFLEISSNYYSATKDLSFFSKYQWIDAVKAVLTVATQMMTPTYSSDARVNVSPYTFERQTNRATETLANAGYGNPVQGGTGLIRSAFRPSDDATIYQFFIPANMMFAKFLDSTANIMKGLDGQAELATKMSTMSSSLRTGIERHGIVQDPQYGDICAYEVDGFGSHNMMDDANIPGLLSAPLFGYVDRDDKVYQATRKFILSQNNPYFMRGPVINAVGGAHSGLGNAWPMASIVRIFTTDNDSEITTTLKEIVSSTNGLGLIHESIRTNDQSIWSRQWFSWANGLFGQMILDLEARKPDILRQSFQ